jgi:outer membrane protein OmpA-like peptidoglycan-associated protein
MWATVFTGSCAVAADVQNFGARVPSSVEFIQALKPPVGKSRGIRPTPAAVSMQVQFDFNSAELSAASTQALDNLGVALSDEQLKGNTFRVEGHTDSVGSAAYNKHLSERRAESVKKYLSQKHHVDPSKLEVVGRGFEEPLNTSDPNSAENRRVQIFNTTKATQ